MARVHGIGARGAQWAGCAVYVFTPSLVWPGARAWDGRAGRRCAGRGAVFMVMNSNVIYIYIVLVFIIYRDRSLLYHPDHNMK
jgi:hypothetical protein